MSTTTTNFGFVKPSLTDAPPDITATNPNWDKVDTKFKEIDEQFDNLGSGVEGVTKSLSPSIWVEQSDGSFTQTITVDLVSTDSEVVVDCNLTGTDIDADIEVMEAWGCVNRAYEGDKTITFVCYGDVPTVAIPLNLVVM